MLGKYLWSWHQEGTKLRSMKNTCNVHNPPRYKNRNYLHRFVSRLTKKEFRISRERAEYAQWKDNVQSISSTKQQDGQGSIGMSGAIFRLYRNALVKKVPINHGVIDLDNGRMLIVITPPDSGTDMAVILEPNDVYNAKKIDG